MPNLYLHNNEIKTVFDLLGDKENDITFSLGWALTQSEVFLKHVLKDVFPKQDTGETTRIDLQRHGGKYGGYTDIEISTDFVHLIVEAKRGLCLPEKHQLEKYGPRFRKRGYTNRILVMAEHEPSFASVKLPKKILSVPINYRSWKEVTKIAKRSATAETNHAAKRLLRDFAAYMEGLMDMQNQKSNQVYVVALGDRNKKPWAGMSWRDYVIKKRLYFQDLNPWPKEPPNYLGFRYDGKLQSIHHIEKHEIVDTLRDRIPAKRNGTWMDYPRRLCKLGPAIKPSHDVRSGNIRDMRVSAALDLLLTCRTVMEAREKTKKRLED